MADRIIKPDSGNDVVIQNNGGTRKIEVTNSGDVEVTGDFKATTVKATNLKANDGTASLEIADSTGDIGFSGNTNLKFKLPSAGGIYESDGSTEILTESSGAVSLKNTAIDSTVTMSANQSAVKTAINASGSAPIYACRAWVNFNGSGTVSVTASGNVSSITDNSTGNYTVNFATAMSDADYCVTFGAPRFNPGNPVFVFQEDANTARTTSAFRMWTNQNASSYDLALIQVAIFR
tara:strand:+ start:6043 stop:6747 length:705 start_codon:yes stop_codon:yes gene_type:complete